MPNLSADTGNPPHSTPNIEVRECHPNQPPISHSGRPEEYLVGYWIGGTRCPMLLEVAQHKSFVNRTLSLIEAGQLDKEDSAYAGYRAITHADKYRTWMEEHIDPSVRNEISETMPPSIKKEECLEWIMGVLFMLLDERLDFGNDGGNGTEFVPKSAITRPQD